MSNGLLLLDRPRQVSRDFGRDGFLESLSENLPALKTTGKSKVGQRNGTTPSRSIVVNEKKVRVLPGVRKVTAGALKVLAGIYRGMVLFVRSGDNWQRVQDSHEIDLGNSDRFETREVRTVARFNRD